MAIHISIRIWDEEDRRPVELVADIVRFLDRAANVEKPWLWCEPGGAPDNGFDSREVLALLHQSADSPRVGVGTAYHLHPDATNAFAVRAWNASEHRDYQGDAELDFRLLRNFVNAGAPPSEHVAQNVLELCDLLSALVEEISVGAIRAYHDEKVPWPINAHFAYFGSPRGVIHDIKVIDRLWWLGDLTYGFKPLHKSRSELSKHFISYRESPRQDVYEQLHELLPYAGRVSEEIVLEELAHSQFDVSQPATGGWFVMQFPYAFDNYIDGFYLDVLRRARDT